MWQTGSYQQHLKSSKDLITPYAQVRAGFVALALERNRRATPAIAEARALKAAASRAQTPTSLLKFDEIKPGLLTAAGVSGKASGHMQEEDKCEAIQGLIKNYLEPAGKDFVEELVSRYLHIRGDALAGSMRNFGGLLAERKLTRCLISTLNIRGESYLWLMNKSKDWIQASKEDSDVELHLKGLSWSVGNHSRVLIYNTKVPIVGNNVDLCLLNCPANEYKKALKEPASYIALGELKGGIDPAGADEHWKTASHALSRIQRAFKQAKFQPGLFFLGAAIAETMAKEIWKQLQDGVLANAGNATDADHIASLCHWLINL